MFHNANFSAIEGLDGWMSVLLVYSGCHRGSSGNPCVGCHNPELWNFNEKFMTVTELEQLCAVWKKCGVDMDGIVLIGGEPLDQDPEEVLGNVTLVRKFFPGAKLFVFTGYNAVPLDHPLVRASDYVKYGEYSPDTPPRKGSKLASGNQRVVRIVRRDNNTVILGEEIAY